MSRPYFTALVILLILVATAMARPVDPPSPILTEATDSTPANDRDIVTVLVAEYNFQTDDDPPLPDPQGWVSVDRTDLWQIDTFNCANLDLTYPDNHAWWCGEYFEICDPGDAPGGYGPGYNASLSWSAAAPDPDASTLVNLTAVLNHDLEFDYDYLYLEWLTAFGWSELQVYTGQQDNVTVDQTFTVSPADYVDGQIHLRWRVESDGGYDSLDCGDPSDGAAQIDNIAVSFNGEIVGDVETCEPGSVGAWSSEHVGNFGRVHPLAVEADPGFTNDTPRWAFVDDGEVEPESDGYMGQSGFDYWVPGGWVVNPEGGLLGPDFSLRNEIRSPILTWPEGGFAGATIQYEVYRHQPIPGPGVYYAWAIRVSTDPAGADGVTGWTNWRDDNFFYYGGPDNIVSSHDVSSYTEPDFLYFQVALRVFQSGYFGEPDATLATPGPYFDNFSVIALVEDPVASFLQQFALAPAGGGVDVSWRVAETAVADDFRVEANSGAETWIVPRVDAAGSDFVAHDRSAALRAGGTFSYALHHRDASGNWQLLDRRDIALDAIPAVTAIQGVYPNPFNPATKITFSVGHAQDIRIAIYDVSGRHVVDLARGEFTAGSHDLEWRGEDAFGRQVSSGTYLLRLETEDTNDARQIMMLK